MKSFRRRRISGKKKDAQQSVRYGILFLRVTTMVGGWPRTSSDEGGEVMEILEVIGLISLVLMALEIGFHFGQKK